MAMAAPTDTFDLGRVRVASGEVRRLALGVRLGDFDFGGERYAVEPALVDATLDISRMTGGGYALRLRFDAGLTCPRLRPLAPPAPAPSGPAWGRARRARRSRRGRCTSRAAARSPRARTCRTRSSTSKPGRTTP